MINIIQKVKSGFLTSYQIKWIALIFMTIDHLGAFGFRIPIFAAHIFRLRQFGRIAAPLFLYMITESVRHTRNKPKFILRLYSAGIFVGLFTAATNFFLGGIVGVFAPGNIMFTFFYTALYICLLEKLFDAVKTKNIKSILIYILLFISTYIPHLIFQIITSHTAGMWIFNHLSHKYQTLFQNLTYGTFIPSPVIVDYSLLFVIMGIMIYFSQTKIMKCVTFFGFCMLCYAGSKIRIDFWLFSTFFGSPQYWMVMALPFMLLYNGKRGKEQKLFFYIYYPVHKYIISIIQLLLT